MANLFGTGINQVPTNGMLGNLAFQDKTYVAVDAIGIGTTFVDSGTASQPLQVAGGGYFSGDVGIGTTNPSAKLDVYGTSRFGGTTSAGRRVDITTDGVVTLAYGNNANPSNLILQNASDTGATTNHGNSILWQFGTSTTTVPINAGEVKIAKELQWTTTATTQDAYFSISLALDGTVGEKLRVTSSGNVGIGTNNPSNRLTVYGTQSDTTPILALLSGNTAAGFTNGAQIAFGYDGTTNYQHFIQTRHNSGNSSNAIDFYVSDGTQNNTLTSGSLHTMSLVSGSVGIGTISPISPLEVSQDTTGTHDLTITNSNTGNNITKASRIRFRLTDSLGTKKDVAYITAYTYNLDSSAGNHLSFFTRTADAAPTEKMRLDKDGNLVLGSSFTATGTASQPLQVNGGAYVSENLVIGTSGKLLVGALGTAALPIISFLNDPNTGLFSPGADQVAISTGGTAKFTVGSLDGNPIIENNFPTVRPALDLAFAATKRLDPRVTFVRATSATYVGGDGLVKTAGVNEARFDHNPTTGESLGLLVEEQRTNLCLQSEDFSTTWTKVAATVTTDAIVSPTGVLNADKLVETIANSSHYAFQSVSVATTLRTASIYLKAGERTQTQIEHSGNAGGAARRITINLSTGAITGASTIGTGGLNSFSESIASVGNGWYRVTSTIDPTVTSGSTQALVAQILNNTGSATYVGDGTSGIYIWGAQLEAGAFPTSYIPTTTAAATRSADVASITGTAFSSWYRQDEGTLFWEGIIDSALPSGSFGQFFDFRLDGSNRLSLYWNPTTTNNVGFFVMTGGVTQVTTQHSLGTNVQSKLSGAYKINDFASSLNGSVVQTDTSGTLPTSIVASIGSAEAGSVLGQQRIRRLTYWPVRLPNATLQSLTS